MHGLPQKIMKTKYKILLTLFTICLIASSLLAFIPTEKICGEETSTCSIVQNSKYKQTLGINNSYFGVIAFTFLILITVSQLQSPKKQKKLILNSGIVICALGAIYFIYLQLFIINALCPYCMIVDIGSIAALAIIIATRKQ